MDEVDIKSFKDQEKIVQIEQIKKDKKLFEQELLNNELLQMEKKELDILSSFFNLSKKEREKKQLKNQQIFRMPSQEDYVPKECTGKELLYMEPFYEKLKERGFVQDEHNVWKLEFKHCDAKNKDGFPVVLRLLVSYVVERNLERGKEDNHFFVLQRECIKFGYNADKRIVKDPAGLWISKKYGVYLSTAWKEKKLEKAINKMQEYCNTREIILMDKFVREVKVTKIIGITVGFAALIAMMTTMIFSD